MIVTVGSIVPSTTHAADGVFGTYFQRMTTNTCTGPNILNGFNPSPYGEQRCTNIGTILAALYGSSTAPAGNAIVGFNSTTGMPLYGPATQWFGTAPGNIYYTGANVGIGTNTPLAKLSVAGDIYTSGILDIQSRGYIGYYRSGPYDQIEFGTPSGSVSDTSFHTNGISRLWIKPTGNIGIGTNLPQAPLDIRGSIGNQTVLRVPAWNGNIATGWPIGWDGGIQTRDILATSLKLNGGIIFPDNTIQATSGAAEHSFVTNFGPRGDVGSSFFPHIEDWYRNYFNPPSFNGWTRVTPVIPTRVSIRTYGCENWDWPTTTWTFGPGQTYPFDTHALVYNAHGNWWYITVGSNGVIRSNPGDISAHSGGCSMEVTTYATF